MSKFPGRASAFPGRASAGRASVGRASVGRASVGRASVARGRASVTGMIAADNQPVSRTAQLARSSCPP
eukprot:4286648-Amphidinium_carterae.1